MPAKKEAVALQKEVLNQEQWDDLMGGEGLYGRLPVLKPWWAVLGAPAWDSQFLPSALSKIHCALPLCIDVRHSLL